MHVSNAPTRSHTHTFPQFLDSIFLKNNKSPCTRLLYTEDVKGSRRWRVFRTRINERKDIKKKMFRIDFTFGAKLYTVI